MGSKLGGVDGSTRTAAVGSEVSTERKAAPAAPVVLGIEPQVQEGNACGTTSLAMALSKITGEPFTQEMVDAQIRLLDTFSSASNMRAFAQLNGVEGRLVNGLKDAEVIENLDRGRPIVFLSDLTPNDPADVARMHWRVIDGYRWQDGELLLHVVDPWGITYWRSWDELAPEWENLKAIGVDTGYNRFGLVLGASVTDAALGPDRKAGITHIERAASATNDTLNDLAEVGKGKLDRIFSAIANALRALFAAIAALFRRRSDAEEEGDGKVAKPPVTMPLPSPRVAGDFAPTPRRASRAEWWDGNAARQQNGAALLRAPSPRGSADALTPPSGPAAKPS